MTKDQFIEKYGDVEVFFVCISKLRIFYENKEVGISCSGNLEYKDCLKYSQTVRSISELDIFRFSVN